MTNTRAFLLILISFMFLSCDNTATQAKETDTKTEPTEAPAACNMSTAFAAFRDAVKNRDTAKIGKVDSDQIAQYRQELFGTDFSQKLSEINADSLFAMGDYSTPVSSKKNKQGEVETEHWIDVTFDKAQNEMILGHQYHFYEEGEKFESSIVYYLDTKDCTVLLKNILMAG
ncbi:MAG: hypothetical protein AB8F95_00845 [Bacteroidia bacterium]